VLPAVASTQRGRYIQQKPMRRAWRAQTRGRRTRRRRRAAATLKSRACYAAQRAAMMRMQLP
jgi:hypothetical protein